MASTGIDTSELRISGQDNRAPWLSPRGLSKGLPKVKVLVWPSQWQVSEQAARTSETVSQACWVTTDWESQRSLLSFIYCF